VQEKRIGSLHFWQRGSLGKGSGGVTFRSTVSKWNVGKRVGRGGKYRFRDGILMGTAVRLQTLTG
jgi:hypothetical protein